MASAKPPPIAELFASYGKSMARRARRVLGSEADAEDAEALMDRRETARLVADAVAALPDAQREAFVGNALEGRTFKEMSRECGVPMGTLMARKKKAVNTIREGLRRADLLSDISSETREVEKES